MKLDRRERKILKVLKGGPLETHAVIQATGLGPRACSIALTGLQMDLLVSYGRMPGEPWRITPAGLHALLDNPSVPERLARKLVCGSCLRLVINPVHWYLRITRWCR